MSVVSDIRSAMRPAKLAPWELKGLFQSIELVLQRAPATPVDVEIPSVTDSGRAYMLLLRLRGGVISSFTVDHEPDQTTPSFVAYHEQRAKWLAEKAARDQAPEPGSKRDTEAGR
jgi:hypothetical protein